MSLDYLSSFSTGGPFPTGGTAPYLRATLTDSGAAGTSVEFKFEIFNLTSASGDHLKKWAFNLTGDQAKLDSLQIKSGSYSVLAGAVSAPTLEKPASNLGGGNPNFDFDFDFGNQNLQEGESVKMSLERNGGGLLSINDFLEFSTTQQGQFYSGLFAAGNSLSYHLGGTPTPVPEASTYVMAAGLIGGLVIVEVRRRRSQKSAVAA